MSIKNRRRLSLTVGLAALVAAGAAIAAPAPGQDVHKAPLPAVTRSPQADLGMPLGYPPVKEPPDPGLVATR